MNKKTIITALFALVTMTGHGQVHYRLEGNIGDSTITGKAVVRDQYVHSGEVIDTVNIIKGIIEPVEGELSDTTICMLVIGDMSEGKRINFASILYPVFLGGGTTVFDGRTMRHPFLKGTHANTPVERHIANGRGLESLSNLDGCPVFRTASVLLENENLLIC